MAAQKIVKSLNKKRNHRKLTASKILLFAKQLTTIETSKMNGYLDCPSVVVSVHASLDRRRSNNEYMSVVIT